MANLFKNIGKGIAYFFAFPGLLIAIALYSVFGLVVFVFQFFKLIVLFFTGRTLFSDLPEDIEVKAMLTKEKPVQEEKKEEQSNPLSLYPSDSPVYGSGYSSPLFNKEEEKEVEVEESVNNNLIKEEPEPEENQIEKEEEYND